MQTLTILNPINLEGTTFASVFKGDKHATLQRDDEVALVDAKDQDLTYADVMDIWSGALAHVPAMLTEMSNDPLQRTFTGLYTHLNFHNKGAIDPSTVVTVLVLKPKSSSIIRPTVGSFKA